SPDMLKRTENVTPTAGLATAAAATATPAQSQVGCDVYKELTVAQLGATPVATPGGEGEQPDLNTANYCKPVDSLAIPEGMLTAIKVWNLPPPDPDMKVDYHWEGGSAISEAQIPDCSEEMIAAVAPPGSVRMPDLRKLGENQAKERLAA